MRDNEPEIEPPEGWSVSKRELTGHFKLVAEYENEETGEKVRVIPYKSYSLPGFPDTHRIVIIHPENGTEEIALGKEVEHVEDAEEAAFLAMKQS